MMAAVQATNLTKRFAVRKSLWKRLKGTDQTKETTAVNGVSLTIEDGEVFGLLGINGAGKTTLIRMLSTLVTPSEGNGVIFGKSLIDEPHEVRKLIGLVTPDERSFYWRLTGRQNLNFIAGVYNLPRREANLRIADLAESLGLTPYMDVPFSHYSTGMRQKLAIARGLLMNPRLLFMDEPTKGLDPIASIDFLKLIEERVIRQYKITVLITTHILREAEVLCDRVCIMNRGNIIACDSPARLQGYFSKTEVYKVGIHHPNDTDYVNRVKAINGVVACEAIAHGNGLVDLEIHLKSEGGALTLVLALLSSKPCEIISCSKHVTSLEESFSRIISNT